MYNGIFNVMMYFDVFVADHNCKIFCMVLMEIMDYISHNPQS